MADDAWAVACAKFEEQRSREEAVSLAEFARFAKERKLCPDEVTDEMSDVETKIEEHMRIANRNAAERARYRRLKAKPGWAEHREAVRRARYARIWSDPQRLAAHRATHNAHGRIDYAQNWRRRQRDCINSARQRGIEYRLTEEQLRELYFSDACHYCKRTRKELGTLMGIDRKNNDLGYLPDNILPCCTDCNNLKKDMTYEGFVGRFDPATRTLRPLVFLSA